MAVTSTELLECGAQIAKNTGGIEANARAAISRVYYAAFTDCLAWHEALPAQGSMPSGVEDKGVHFNLAAKLSNPSPSLPTEIQDASRLRGSALRLLHADRVKADYRTRLSISAQDARTALGSARKICAA